MSVDVFKSNIVADDLPQEVDRIAVANIDVDIYEAVAAALLKVSPLMSVGGIMVVEDPGHTPLLIGARVALQEFLETEAASRFLPLYVSPVKRC